MRVPEHDGVPLLAQHVVDADVLRVERGGRRGRCCSRSRGRRRTRPSRSCRGARAERAAGRGRRDEVDAAPPSVTPAWLEARRGLRQRCTTRCRRGRRSGGEHDERRTIGKSRITARQCTGGQRVHRAAGYRLAAVSAADERLEQLRAARRPGRPEPPAGADARHQRADRACAARPRDRARGLRRGRPLRRRPLHRPARAPRAHRAGAPTSCSASRRRGSSSG